MSASSQNIPVLSLDPFPLMPYPFRPLDSYSQVEDRIKEIEEFIGLTTECSQDTQIQYVGDLAINLEVLKRRVQDVKKGIAFPSIEETGEYLKRLTSSIVKVRCLILSIKQKKNEFLYHLWQEVKFTNCLSNLGKEKRYNIFRTEEKMVVVSIQLIEKIRKEAFCVARGGSGDVFFVSNNERKNSPYIHERSLLVIKAPKEGCFKSKQLVQSEVKILRKIHSLGISKGVEKEKIVFYNNKFLMSWRYSTDLLRCKSLKFEQILNGFADILEAVNALHRHKIFHGDIKPENIFVEKDELFLGDFGGSVDFEAVNLELRNEMPGLSLEEGQKLLLRKIGGIKTFRYCPHEFVEKLKIAIERNNFVEYFEIMGKKDFFALAVSIIEVFDKETNFGNWKDVFHPERRDLKIKELTKGLKNKASQAVVAEIIHDSDPKGAPIGEDKKRKWESLMRAADKD